MKGLGSPTPAPHRYTFTPPSTLLGRNSSHLSICSSFWACPIPYVWTRKSCSSPELIDRIGYLAADLKVVPCVRSVQNTQIPVEVPRDVIVEKQVVKTVEVEKPVIKEVQVVVTATPAPDTFPLSIEHNFGAVTIPQPPRRVITVGFSEQDPVLALGVNPVAVREWFGDHPYATWSWAQDELGSAQPTVLKMPFGELDYEQIAALRPDIIVATHSGITQQEYERLSQIAPTLAQSGDYPDFGMPWQEQTLSIGHALGLASIAEDAVSDVEAKAESAGKLHPQFQGATVAWVSLASGQGQYWAAGATTPPMRFLASLGFAVPADLAEVIGDKDSAQISSEQLGLLDVDVLIYQGRSEEGVETLQSDLLFRQMNVARENRTVFFSSSLDPVFGSGVWSIELQHRPESFVCGG